jgi:uncharacterized protein (DUF1330 family)
MPTYILAQLNIHDRERYERYVARFDEVLSKFEGRLLAADETPTVLVGEWPYQKLVLIEFKDAGEAMRWATSPDYQRISVDREAATTATVLSVTGV